MVADISTRADGTAEFFNVRNVKDWRGNAWWDAAGRWTVEEAPRTIEEARKLSGTDWEVEMVPVPQVSARTPDGKITYNIDEALPGTEIWSNDPNRVAWVRSDTGLRLNIASKSSHAVPNQAMWELAYAFVDGTDTARVATGGALDEGRKLWALVELDEPVQITGDFTSMLPYLCIKLPHDGSGAMSAEYTAIRVECWNTWQISGHLAQQLKTIFKVNHFGNWDIKLEEAKKGIAGLRGELERHTRLMNKLAETPVDWDKAFAELQADLFPMPAPDQASKITMTNVERDRAAIAEVAKRDSNDLEPTAYKLLCVTTEFYDYQRRYLRANSLIKRTLIDKQDTKQSLLPRVARVAGLKMQELVTV